MTLPVWSYKDDFTFIGYATGAVRQRTRLYVHSAYAACGAVVTEDSMYDHYRWHEELYESIARRDDD